MGPIDEQLQDVTWQPRTSNMIVWRHKAQLNIALGHIILHNSSVSAFVMNKFIGFYDTDTEAKAEVESRVRERLAHEHLAEQRAASERDKAARER